MQNAAASAATVHLLFRSATYMKPSPVAEVRFTSSLDEAIEILSDEANKLVPIAGGTWLVRGEQRKDPLAQGYLALSKVKEMHGIQITANEISIGAMTTHEQLSKALEDDCGFQGLGKAATKSANPGVRRLATVGGNICAKDFLSPDLVPALIAAAATVQVASSKGRYEVSIAEFLEQLLDGICRELLVRVLVKRTRARSAHARLTMRSAGDYPTSIVSVMCETNSDGAISDIRIAVGAVQDQTFRWSTLEKKLLGVKLTEIPIIDVARTCLNGLTGRDAVDGPGAYRVQVLPHLVEEAFADLSQQFAGGKSWP